MQSSDNQKISVVVTAFNYYEYLEETIASIFASSHTLLEVIIVSNKIPDTYTQFVDTLLKDTRIKLLEEPFKNISEAKNKAIEQSTGNYLVCLESGNLVSKLFIQNALNQFAKNDKYKIVFGQTQSTENKIIKPQNPKFKIKTFAYKNGIYSNAMFRKSDFDLTDGFCSELPEFEYWDLWINILKYGGKVVCLPDFCHYYYPSNQSNSSLSIEDKKKQISILNGRHKAFFYKELGGLLRFPQSCSRTINVFAQQFKPEHIAVNPDFAYLNEFVYQIPEIYDTQGELVHDGHNTIKIFDYKGQKISVKSFEELTFLHRFFLRNFTTSEARRFYRYALNLYKSGIGTPAPIGYYEQKSFLVFSKSYCASIQPDKDSVLNKKDEK